jgi:hypothetical protein
MCLRPKLICYGRSKYSLSGLLSNWQKEHDIKAYGVHLKLEHLRSLALSFAKTTVKSYVKVETHRSLFEPAFWTLFGLLSRTFLYIFFGPYYVRKLIYP